MTLLSLRKNQILSVCSLLNLTDLKQINLDSNKLDSIECLAKMKSLSGEFKCMQNFLIALASDFFKNFNSLTSINLENNKLKILLSYTFSHLNYLTFINLDNNQIEEIQTFSFFNLPSIKTITLQNNNIKMIFGEAFFMINIFNHVNVFANYLLNVTFENTFKNINQMHLSYKTLIGSSLDLNMISLDLSECKIETLHTNTIRGKFIYLNLENNLISKFENKSFGQLDFLKEINLAKNLIKQLSFSEAFEFSLKSLEKLIFKNNKIDFIDSFRFFSKFPNLLVLDVSNNRLRSLGENYLLELKSLKFLYLSNNQILNIDEGVFRQLNSLIHLDLSKNLIYTLENSCNISIFTELIGLERLELSMNKIENFPINLNLSKNLAHLDLGQNKIKEITNASLYLLENLKELILRENFLKKFLVSNLKSIEILDLSVNLLDSFLMPKIINLFQVKLDKNLGLNMVEIHEDLKSLSLAKTNSSMILSLTFPTKSKLEDLDLSLNNLTYLASNYFKNLKHLRKLNLRETNLIDFEFLLESKSTLVLLDVSSNIYFSKNSNFMIKQLEKLTLLYVTKCGLRKFPHTSLKYEYLDLSFNNLNTFDLNNLDTLVYLDLSFNNFISILDNQIEIKGFMNFYTNLKSINLSFSLRSMFSNRVFHFNKMLENAYLSGNNLNLFPKFCQNIDELYFECGLKVVLFDSNNLESLTLGNLFDLSNLEYLNLENNSLSFIETNSFSYLAKLEILLLANNKLKNFNNSEIFRPLVNLHMLNLSFNQIEIVQSNLFSDLQKLETLDLSSNRIFLFQSFAVNNLFSLKHLFINENDKNLKFESSLSLNELNSLQNIYLSRSILINENSINVFLTLFEQRKSYLNKMVLGKQYFKSLFLISNYFPNDCKLILFFIGKNIHFNFKTETHIYNYFRECSFITIKNMTLNDETSSFCKSRLCFFLENALFYFFALTLVSIFTLTVYFCLN